MESATIAKLATQASVSTPEGAEHSHDSTQIIRVNVSWDAYSGLVTALGDHNHVRLAYNRETLEIMSPGLRHEQIARLVATILVYAFNEWEIDYEESGATTFTTEGAGGFDGAASFYVANADRIRGLDRIDLSVDPAPDLILEIDITNRRMDKKETYSKVGVGEFWRFDEKDGLEAFEFDKGAYTKINVSQVVRGLPLAAVNMFIQRLQEGDKRPAIIATAKQWLRDNRHLHDTGSA